MTDVRAARAAILHAFRDFKEDGVPTSGLNLPDLPEIRGAFAALADVTQIAVQAAAGGIAGYPTFEDLPVLAAGAVGTLARVESDGVYRWTGSEWEAFDDPATSPEALAGIVAEVIAPVEETADRLAVLRYETDLHLLDVVPQTLWAQLLNPQTSWARREAQARTNNAAWLDWRAGDRSGPVPVPGALPADDDADMTPYILAAAARLPRGGIIRCDRIWVRLMSRLSLPDNIVLWAGHSPPDQRYDVHDYDYASGQIIYDAACAPRVDLSWTNRVGEKIDLNHTQAQIDALDSVIDVAGSGDVIGFILRPTELYTPFASEAEVLTAFSGVGPETDAFGRWVYEDDVLQTVTDKDRYQLWNRKVICLLGRGSGAHKNLFLACYRGIEAIATDRPRADGNKGDARELLYQKFVLDWSAIGTNEKWPYLTSQQHAGTPEADDDVTTPVSNFRSGAAYTMVTDVDWGPLFGARSYGASVGVFTADCDNTSILSFGIDDYYDPDDNNFSKDDGQGLKYFARVKRASAVDGVISSQTFGVAMAINDTNANTIHHTNVRITASRFANVLAISGNYTFANGSLDILPRMSDGVPVGAPRPHIILHSSFGHLNFVATTFEGGMDIDYTNASLAEARDVQLVGCVFRSMTGRTLFAHQLQGLVYVRGDDSDGEFGRAGVTIENRTAPTGTATGQAWRIVVVDGGNLRIEDASDNVTLIDVSPVDGKLRVRGAGGRFITPQQRDLGEDFSAGLIATLADVNRTRRSTADGAAVACVLPATAQRGDHITIVQGGTAQVEFNAGTSSVPVRALANRLRTAGQYASVTALCVANATGTDAAWYLQGDTAEAGTPPPDPDPDPELMPPVCTVLPVITPSSATVGTELSGSLGEWNPDGTKVRQWKRGATNVGTDSETYTPVATGEHTLEVTTTNADGSTTATSLAVNVTEALSPYDAYVAHVTGLAVDGARDWTSFLGETFGKFVTTVTEAPSGDMTGSPWAGRLVGDYPSLSRLIQHCLPSAAAMTDQVADGRVIYFEIGYDFGALGTAIPYDRNGYPSLAAGSAKLYVGKIIYWDGAAARQMNVYAGTGPTLYVVP